MAPFQIKGQDGRHDGRMRRKPKDPNAGSLLDRSLQDMELSRSKDYTVQKGDTLYDLARRSSPEGAKHSDLMAMVQAIAGANGIQDINKIDVGQRLQMDPSFREDPVNVAPKTAIPTPRPESPPMGPMASVGPPQLPPQGATIPASLTPDQGAMIEQNMNRLANVTPKPEMPPMDPNMVEHPIPRMQPTMARYAGDPRLGAPPPDGPRMSAGSAVPADEVITPSVYEPTERERNEEAQLNAMRLAFAMLGGAAMRSPPEARKPLIDGLHSPAALPQPKAPISDATASMRPVTQQTGISDTMISPTKISPTVQSRPYWDQTTQIPALASLMAALGLSQNQ